MTIYPEVIAMMRDFLKIQTSLYATGPRNLWWFCTRIKEWMLTMKIPKKKKKKRIISSTSVMMNKTITGKDRNRLFKNRR